MSASQAASNMAEDIPLIKIVVGQGEDSREFTVRQDRLFNRSDFFKAALSWNIWAEAQDRVVHLPEEGSYIFERYLAIVNYSFDSLLHGDFEQFLATSSTASRSMLVLNPVEPGYDGHYTLLVDIYLLADYLQDAEMKHKTPEELKSLRGKYVDRRGGPLPVPRHCHRAMIQGTIADQGEHRDPARAFLIGCWITDMRACFARRAIKYC
jgi:hypothetical protein